ncbi:GtrA family protein [Aestuariivirga litoralis]|nr:GtrA family protein [Aestuariivirga litoralis]
MTAPREWASPEAWRILRFLLVGGLNTVFGFAVYGLGLALGLAPEIALAVAFVVGVAFNFLTTGRIVFRQSRLGLLPRFIAVYCAVYVMNALALRGLIEAGLSPLVAQLILQPLSAALTYLLFRHFVFTPDASPAGGPPRRRP